MISLRVRARARACACACQMMGCDMGNYDYGWVGKLASCLAPGRRYVPPEAQGLVDVGELRGVIVGELSAAVVWGGGGRAHVTVRVRDRDRDSTASMSIFYFICASPSTKIPTCPRRGSRRSRSPHRSNRKRRGGTCSGGSRRRRWRGRSRPRFLPGRSSPACYVHGGRYVADWFDSVESSRVGSQSIERQPTPDTHM